MFAHDSPVWVGLGRGSSSLLYMVLAGVAHLSWRISDGFTRMSGAPARVAKMSGDSKASFSPYGFSVYQGKWTLLHGVSGLSREKKKFQSFTKLGAMLLLSHSLGQVSHKVILELRERKIEPSRCVEIRIFGGCLCT